MSIKRLKLQMKKKCICGSDKNFEDCCYISKYGLEYKGNDGIRYVYLNFKDKPIIFNKKTSDEVGFFYDNLVTNIEKVDKVHLLHAKGIIKKIYEQMDISFELFNDFSSCEKGCIHCCCQLVNISRLEADIISDYVLDKFSNRQIANLNKKINEVMKITPPFSEVVDDIKLESAGHTSVIVKSYFDKKAPCIFIENNSCTVYDVRPSVCRSEISFAKQEICSEYNHPYGFIYKGPFSELPRKAIEILNNKTYGLEKCDLQRRVNSIQFWFKNEFILNERSFVRELLWKVKQKIYR